MSNHLSEAQQDALLNLVEQAERIEQQIADMNGAKSDLYKSAVNFDLDPKAVRNKVSERRKIAKDPEKFRADQDKLDVYELALEAAGKRRSKASRAVQSPQAAQETPVAPVSAPANGKIDAASRTRTENPPHDPETGEVSEIAEPVFQSAPDAGDVPDFLRRA